jgi:OOP family OmpA-OmpF porin
VQLRRRTAAFAVAAAFAAPAARARAEEIGYQLSRFEPAPAGDAFVLVEYPWYAPIRRLALGLSYDLAEGLVVAADGVAPIDRSQTVHLDVAGAIGRWLGFALSVPLVVEQDGTPLAGVGPSGTTLGDPRLSVRTRILGDHDDALTVSASASVWIPVGAADALAGDNGPRGQLRLGAGGLWRDRLRWAVNLGALARSTARLSAQASDRGNTVGSELQASAAVAYSLLPRRLAVGPEVVTALAIASDLPAGQRTVAAEGYLTARVQLPAGLALGLGVGTALAGEPGPPERRAVLSLTYAPPAPGRGPAPMPTSSFEQVVVLPDEDGHVGAVVVDDGASQIVLDQPYAATELRRGDRAARAVTSSAAQVERATAAAARALPPPDRDGDGVADRDDACPDRAGAASADRLRHGCPAAAEKVVLLPDGDGHVGAIEVDDGTTRTVLDVPYASIEVGADGQARLVPAVPATAAERALAAVAAALPPADADDDGVVDGEDTCPRRPGVASATNPLAHGCPVVAERVLLVPDADGHVGAIEVSDGSRALVLDVAWAAVEVGADGQARPVDPAPAAAIERALTTLAAAMPILDEDGDGVRYEDDACPDRAGVASPDPLRHGCPAAAERVVLVPSDDGHVGAVEVTAGTTSVVVDAPWASADVDRAGVVTAVPPAPAAALARATAALAAALPPPDRDDDGLTDAADQCPDRAGPTSADPVRTGCPATVEQVVVLADENGTIGAVEVTDGTGTIVLDKEYAAAEVGADGRARGLTIDAAEVSARFAAAMAARPPGARIILYFTARSEPVRDLTGPIDNLVAEVKAKGSASFTIEVIGHTDQTGSERANVRIGRQRAQLIADRLIAAGVPADRITVTSMGSREPAVKRRSRRTVELRNRRVEIWVR